MLDGRHTGTGGGNHIVSAARRRPTARSCGGPICSAAWSATGTTIRRCRTCSRGCSSGRRVSIRASTRRATIRSTSWRSRSRRLADARSAPPPWLVDRLFRNLLIDVTGNTHRAEFCIDKLYAPDSSSGRQGLVELRAFEMPPHARMSLTQQLLLRALIAWFWKTPYNQPLVRWGTELHDRFMLPHFVGAGLRRRRGRSAAQRVRAARPSGSRRISSSASRCTARVTRRGVHLELRQALEPWHVMGEEAGAGGDGALRGFLGRTAAGEGDRHDRLAPRRHVQRPRVPLHPTGTVGEFVAGVRYRAWQPPTACIRRFRCTRRSCSISSTPGTSARWAAASTTSRIPAGGTSRPFRSTRTKRRAGAWRGSSTSATRRVR